MIIMILTRGKDSNKEEKRQKLISHKSFAYLIWPVYKLWIYEFDNKFITFRCKSIYIK